MSDTQTFFDFYLRNQHHLMAQSQKIIIEFVHSRSERRKEKRLKYPMHQ